MIDAIAWCGGLKTIMVFPKLRNELLNDSHWGSVKMKYKMKRHVERWERRYNKKYPELSSEILGMYQGACIIID